MHTLVCTPSTSIVKLLQADSSTATFPQASTYISVEGSIAVHDPTSFSVNPPETIMPVSRTFRPPLIVTPPPCTSIPPSATIKSEPSTSTPASKVAAPATDSVLDILTSPWTVAPPEVTLKSPVTNSSPTLLNEQPAGQLDASLCSAARKIAAQSSPALPVPVQSAMTDNPPP